MSATPGAKLPCILVVGYRKFGQLMNTVMPEFRGRADIRIVEHLLDTDVGMEQLVARHGADVVISAGANAAYLAATLQVPVLSLEVSDTDIIEAMVKAREISRRILLVTYGPASQVLQSLEPLLELALDHRCYQTVDEAREQFLLASLATPEVVVGASLICELAERAGFASILLYSRKSCRDLLARAVDAGEQLLQQRRAGAWEQALLQDPQIPTLLLGVDGRIFAANACAQTAFRLEEGGRARLERALEAAEQTFVFEELRWQISRSAAIAGALHCGEVLRFVPEPVAAPVRRRSHALARRLVFASGEMQQIDELIRVYADAPGTVLIQGESGTGKELVALRLHSESAYAGGELVAVNCGAIPEELFESELFGYVEGAFTSSRRGGRRGLFEQANHGVLFLDEIGEMPLGQQSKLLRVLEERRIRALGSNREIALDLKVIAATNGDLRQRVAEGRFREDLFYRLNVFSLFLPPLRQRRKDIAVIARYLLHEYATRYDARIDEAATYEQLAERLLAYQWPGNVRELENFIERIVVSARRLGAGAALRDALPHVLPELFAAADEPRDNASGALRAQEMEMITDALRKFGNDRSRAAEYLGISQTTLWRRLKGKRTG